LDGRTPPHPASRRASRFGRRGGGSSCSFQPKVWFKTWSRFVLRCWRQACHRSVLLLTFCASIFCDILWRRRFSRRHAAGGRQACLFTLVYAVCCGSPTHTLPFSWFATFTIRFRSHTTRSSSVLSEERISRILPGGACSSSPLSSIFGHGAGGTKLAC